MDKEQQEDFLLILSAMFARQFIMLQVLVDQLEHGDPITKHNFAIEFISRWHKERTDTIVMMRRRFDQDSLKWTIEDLEKGQEPPDTKEENDG